MKNNESIYNGKTSLHYDHLDKDWVIQAIYVGKKFVIMLAGVDTGAVPCAWDAIRSRSISVVVVKDHLGPLALRATALRRNSQSSL